MISKTFCVAPFIGVEFRKDGSLTPCCRYDKSAIDEETWNFRNFDNWWSELLTPLRSELLNDIEHAGCQNCWRDEKLGITSYRQNLNAELKKYINLTEPLATPTYQMYNYGNFCNLKCIMCSPFASSQIEAEYKQNKKEFSKIGIHYLLDTEVKWFRSEEFNSAKNKLLDGSEQILLQGGEPFLSPDVIKLLADVAYPENVILTVISNMTTLTNEITDLLRKFKQVRLVVSLEGIEAFNDYLRYGSTWSEIADNINTALSLPNIDFKIAHTFQRTSLTCWFPLLKWAASQKIEVMTNILDTPDFLAVGAATAEEKNIFINTAEEFLTDLNAQYVPFKSPTMTLTVQSEIDGYYRTRNKLINVISTINKLKTYVESSTYNLDQDQRFWTYIDLIDRLRGKKLTDLFDTIRRPV